ncbi:MAG: hypothetical protein V2B18_02055 [Pseudomonadota bacterium]
MYWKLNEQRIRTVTLPCVLLGSNSDFTLVLATEEDERLKGAYLCVLDEAHAGYFSAKPLPGGLYREIPGVGNPNCYLGHLPALTATPISFRVGSNPMIPEGSSIVTLVVRHDDATGPPNPYLGMQWTAPWAGEWSGRTPWEVEWKG